MTTLSAPPVLTQAIGGSSKIYIKGFGGLSTSWRVDVHKSGSGELLGYGPTDTNGNFEFDANHAILNQVKGNIDIVARFNDGVNSSYWSGAMRVYIS